MIVSTSGYAFYEYSKNEVRVNVDGKVQTVHTHAKTVLDVFELVGIQPKEQDEISHPLDEKVTNKMNLSFVPATLVSLVIEEEITEVWTTEKNVEDFLKEQKVTVDEHDFLSHGLDEQIKADMEIHYKKSYPVTLNYKGEHFINYTTSMTVADYLSSNQYVFDENDKISPEKDTFISGETEIQVIDVEVVTDVLEESVPFATTHRKDEKLEKGKSKVVQAGKPGVLRKTYEKTLENGKEVSSKLLSTETVEKPVEKLVAVGTKVFKQTPSRSRTTVKNTGTSTKEFYVSSTAYTAHCNGCSGITATGINLRSNPNAKVIAVDPSLIPLGTKVWVEGYGQAIAGDTGGRIKGKKIDVYFPTKNQAYSWGNRRVKIKILK